MTHFTQRRSLSRAEKTERTTICRFRTSLLAAALLLLVAAGATAQTRISEVRTDKARYNPGNTVNFTLTLNQSQSGLSLEVRNFHLSNVIAPQTVTVPSTGTTVTWSWTPPNTDYKGYLVSIRLKNGSTILDETSIGVDVSSDWGRFPRYGFLSNFGYKSDWDMDVMIRKLNRYHINGIQFYDWMDKHHRPLAGTVTSPSTTWYDLANRLTYFETVKGYIDRGHNHNMKSMFYNLLYGAYPNSSGDGVSSTWGLYRDQTHTNRYTHGGLPSSWETTAIDVLDPSNTNWRNYIFAEHNKVYNATNLHFDGWHVDQLGDPGAVYNYNGTRVYLDQTYGPFLTAAKNARTDRELVMNAVNQYGQGGTNGIAQAPVKFLYAELWSGNEGYYNLGNLVQQNESIKSGSRTVFAAYVNKGKSGSAGTFNDASVLMADATIFAFGGAHIELGEHMLGNEYFPNSNLQMSAQLQKDIIKYYDFQVAYENVLRDGRAFNNVTLSGGTNVRYWPPVQGKVATVGVSWNGRQVFHLLNYTQAQTMNWRDDNQVQPVPTVLNNLALNFPYTATVNKIWVASPDFNNGLPQQITFTQSNGTVSFSLPQLKYWSMVVVEPTGAARTSAAGAETSPETVSFDLESNVPNPFGGETTIRFSLTEKQAVKLYLAGPQGFARRTLLDKTLEAGKHEVRVQGAGLKPGVYVCQLVTDKGVKSRKLVKIE